jgi:membrane glycosyltransferase
MARLHSAVWTQPDQQAWGAYYNQLPRNVQAFPVTQTLEVKPA